MSSAIFARLGTGVSGEHGDGEVGEAGVARSTFGVARRDARYRIDCDAC
jgi:hypothetical protein